MRIKKNIAISEEGFLFNPSTGDSFSTNKIGCEIINLLKEGLTSREIVDIVYAKYDVDKKIFERDLDEFSTVLKEYNIIDL